MAASTNNNLGFQKRRMEFRAKAATRLLGNPNGVPVTPLQFRQEAGDVKREQQGATYHNVYSPTDIRRVREKLDPEFMNAVANPASGLPPFVCVHVTKGGVGKTSVTASLAVCLAAQGYRVLLIDGDPQGSTSEIFGIETDHPDLKTLRNIMREGSDKCAPEDAAISIYENATLDLIPADNLMTRYEKELSADSFGVRRFHKLVKGELQPFFSKYDIVLVDTGPSSSTLNTSLMVAASMVLGVVSLDGMSLKALNTLGNDIKDIEEGTGRAVPVMLVANKYHAGQIHCLNHLKMLKDMYGDVLCENVIPTYIGFDKQMNVWEPEKSRPLFEQEPTVPASEVIVDVSRAILKRLVQVQQKNAPETDNAAAAVAAA